MAGKDVEASLLLAPASVSYSNRHLLILMRINNGLFHADMPPKLFVSECVIYSKVHLLILMRLTHSDENQQLTVPC
jgi:hypothetical protein